MSEENNLHDLLEKLQTELERTEPSDEAGRERIRRLQDDIRSLRERSGEETDEPMLERFQEAVDEFETSHPELTLMISQMMTILSNAGI